MDLENRFIIYDDLSVVDKIETYELHTLFDQSDNSFYFIADSLKNVEHLCKKLNDKENIILTLEEINNELEYDLDYYKSKSGSLENELFDVKRELEKVKKQYYLLHMASMFSTVKSFKGKVDERYKYDEVNDMIYDTANHYGQYSKIIEKDEATLLLNEYNALLENGE